MTFIATSGTAIHGQSNLADGRSSRIAMERIE
jgi:hypothetical protein